MSAIRPYELPRINTQVVWLGYTVGCGVFLRRCCGAWGEMVLSLSLYLSLACASLCCARGGEMSAVVVVMTAIKRRGCTLHGVAASPARQEDRPACRCATRSPETESRWRPWDASHESVEVTFSNLSDCFIPLFSLPPSRGERRQTVKLETAPT